MPSKVLRELARALMPPSSSQHFFLQCISSNSLPLEINDRWNWGPRCLQHSGETEDSSKNFLTMLASPPQLPLPVLPGTPNPCKRFSGHFPYIGWRDRKAPHPPPMLGKGSANLLTTNTADHPPSPLTHLPGDFLTQILGWNDWEGSREGMATFRETLGMYLDMTVIRYCYGLNCVTPKINMLKS